MCYRLSATCSRRHWNAVPVDQTRRCTATHTAVLDRREIPSDGISPSPENGGQQCPTVCALHRKSKRMHPCASPLELVHRSSLLSANRTVYQAACRFARMCRLGLPAPKRRSEVHSCCFFGAGRKAK